MSNEIDTSNWPQPGETWIARNTIEYGPLQIDRMGMLYHKDTQWTPSGNYFPSGDVSAYDLIIRVEKLPEPIERFLEVYPNYISCLIHEDKDYADRVEQPGGQTYRVRITFLEEVK